MNKNEFDLEAVVQGNTTFALALYRSLQRLKGNFVFSPHGISSALAMTFAGAEGETARQMARVLHFSLKQNRLHAAFSAVQQEISDSSQSGETVLKTANALRFQKGLTLGKKFRSLIQKRYAASFASLDFRSSEAARQEINAWVKQATQDKIKDLIPEGAIDARTRLVLLNAIYFKGNWATPFKEELTQPKTFHLSTNEQMQTPMMTQENTFYYVENDLAQILALPYADSELMMVILLPLQIDGLEKLENAMSLGNLEDWMSRMRETEVNVSLPRFKLNRMIDLKAVLTAMGMVDAFGDQANFSGLTENKNDLYISSIFHKTMLEVNEQGAEAAAGAGVVVKARSMFAPPVFCADHPFIFFICENTTGSLLFLGRVMNPAGEIG